ncbi:hypothetical protein JL721_11645 [Aureococcus anophagefferens]|nr:hypothetical protein JL721_11645 [Aureococcus anophagefferens]
MMMLRRIAFIVALVAIPTSGNRFAQLLERLVGGGLEEKKRAPQVSPLTSDDVAHYFRTGDLDELCWALRDYFSRTSRQLGPLDGLLPLREALVAKGAGNTYASAYKLDHDIEQLEYVAKRNATVRAWLDEHDVLGRFRRVRARIPPLEALGRTRGLWGFRPDDVEDIGAYYNRAIHVPDPEPLGQYLQIRSLLLESTVFYETKMPEQFGGYVGAIVEDGLHARALLELASALQRAMPETFRDRPLAYLWCYKYDSDYGGIKVHADEAAVNVNVWLTPDDANLDPAGGGLVIYTAKPGAAASAEEYNSRGDEFARELLEATDYANVTVPYKQNRIVIFDSALYHKTDDFTFKPGYENRRINLTFLFGKMRRGDGEL